MEGELRLEDFKIPAVTDLIRLPAERVFVCRLGRAQVVGVERAIGIQHLAKPQSHRRSRGRLRVQKLNA